MLRVLRQCALVGATVGCLSAAPAGGQVDPLANLGDPVETVNRQLGATPEGERSELVLLPAIAAMDAPPEGLTIAGAVLLTSASPNWAAAGAWAQAPAQREAIAALERVTEPGARFRFALGYGERAVGSAVRETGLYPRLTDGRLLAGMEMAHLGALDRLFILALVEAERRVSAGEASGGVDILMRMTRLARSVADRSFYREKVWALRTMIRALEASRDLVYVHSDRFDEATIQTCLRWVDERDIAADRLQLPAGDRLATLQLVRETFVRLGRPDPARFGATMAMVHSADKPLALFGEAGWWRRVGESHADYYTTIDAAEGLFRDWQFRWSLSPYDELMKQTTDYSRLDAARHALILETTPSYQELFELRRQLRTESAGTRLALGAMGHKARMGAFPNPLFAIRPRFVREIDTDPFDPAQQQPLRYFVPIRDQPRVEREAPRPHTIQVLGAGSLASSAADAEADSGAALAGTVIGALGDFAPDQAREMAEAVPMEAARPLLLDALRSIAREGMDPAETAAFLQRIASERAPGGDAPMSMTQEEARHFERFIGIVLETESVREALDVVRAGGAPQDAQLRTMLVDVIELFFTEYVAQLANDAAGGVADAFSVDLDDSVFVLYSVGRDGMSQMARSVGPAGTDYLIWPPVVSLVREQMAGR